MKIYLSKSKVLGRSMIEMLGVLAIIGVLSAGGVWGYNVAMENYRVNKHFSDLKQMAINMQGIYNKPPKAYSSKTFSNIKGLGLLTDNYEKGKSVWGTRVSFAVDELSKCSGWYGAGYGIANSNYPCTFVYTLLWGISESVCRKLLAFDIKKYFEGFDIYVATNAYDSVLNYVNIPLTPAQATTYCKGNNANRYIVWRIYWNHKRV